MLNTFFFGYLPLKWKRFARVLSIILCPITIYIFLDLQESLGLIVHILLVPIISYTLKPFIVKG